MTNAVMTKRSGSSSQSKSGRPTRCEITFERCAGGCRILCCCDAADCKTLQDLCGQLANRPCSIRCERGECAVCECNFDFCNCTCTAMADGICITCTSSDKACCEMIEAICDCLSCCLACGCCCTVCLDGQAVCCQG